MRMRMREVKRIKYYFHMDMRIEGGLAQYSTQYSSRIYIFTLLDWIKWEMGMQAGYVSKSSSPVSKIN